MGHQTTLGPLLWAIRQHLGHCYGPSDNTWATVTAISQTLV